MSNLLDPSANRYQIDANSRLRGHVKKNCLNI